MMLDINEVVSCRACNHHTSVADNLFCSKTGQKVALADEQKFPEKCPLAFGIFFVTGVSGDKHEVGLRRRTFGYFTSKKEAVCDVEANACDMNEAGHYPYIVIEQTAPGVHGFSSDQEWFKYSKADDRYEPCEIPPGFKKTCNWGVG